MHNKIEWIKILEHSTGVAQKGEMEAAGPIIQDKPKRKASDEQQAPSTKCSGQSQELHSHSVQQPAQQRAGSAP